MKIIVLMKEIFDTNQIINLDKKSDLINTINIHDEYAIEEAILLKEKYGGTVVMYTLGSKETQKTANYYMSMGIDRVELVISDDTRGKETAKILSEKIKENDSDYDLILAGISGIDLNRGEVPGRLAHRFDIPFINGASFIDVNETKLICKREIEKSEEIIETFLPALITVYRGINNPRFPSIDRIFTDKEDLINKTFIFSEKKEDYFLEKIEKIRDVKMINGESMEEKVENLLILLKQNKLL